jgi:hypothetical protein
MSLFLEWSHAQLRLLSTIDIDAIKTTGDSLSSFTGENSSLGLLLVITKSPANEVDIWIPCQSTAHKSNTLRSSSASDLNPSPSPKRAVHHATKRALLDVFSGLAASNLLV